MIPWRVRYAALKTGAETILREPLPEYVLPDGKRLLATSREVLERGDLAMIYRIEQEPGICIDYGGAGGGSRRGLESAAFP